jgi:hypothetical protein
VLTIKLNSFFEKKLSLVDCFIDRSFAYYLSAKSNNPKNNFLYIHSAVKRLAEYFQEENNLKLKVIELESTSMVNSTEINGEWILR